MASAVTKPARVAISILLKKMNFFSPSDPICYPLLSSKDFFGVVMLTDLFPFFTASLFHSWFSDLFRKMFKE